MTDDTIGRRHLLKLGLGASLFTLTQLAHCTKKTGKKTNILFIFSDDQQYNTIRALGNNHIVTPNLDSLVRRGTSFTNAHIMGGTSSAVCMPSRAMLLSGRTLFHLEGKGRRIPPEHITLPEVLRNAGYTTYHTGKWHQDGAMLARDFNDSKYIFGFAAGDWMDEWDAERGAHWNMPLHDLNPDGKYTRNNRYIVGRTAGAPPTTHSSTLFTNAAVDFLRAHNPENPFFMYLAYLAPHDPRQSPKEYRDMYDPDTIPLPANYLPQHPFNNGELRGRDESLETWPRPPESIKRHIADYYAAISHMDAQIGRVLNVLKETGQDNNTIIVFAADNGLALGQNGLMGKQNLYQHSVRVPLIFCGPGIPENELRNTFCYLIDIFPTLLDFVNVPAPATVEGRRLTPALSEPGHKVRDNLHFAYRDFQRAYRDERFKIIEYKVDDVRTTQLFDLRNDPGEINNLADNDEYAGELTRLRKELIKWKTEMGDTSVFWDGYIL